MHAYRLRQVAAGSVSYKVEMSVAPWMVEWPRRAIMPPPGRPMLPSNSCRMPASSYDLHAGGVLRPAPAHRRCKWSARGRSYRRSNSATRNKLVRRAAAHLGDNFRRVAGEMPSQNLHHALRVLQSRVALCVCHVLVRGRVWGSPLPSAPGFMAVASSAGLSLISFEARGRSWTPA